MHVDKVCKVEGCSKEARSRGWCIMHYGRWLRSVPVETKRKCVACGKEFSDERRGGRHKYCSEECYRKKSRSKWRNYDKPWTRAGSLKHFANNRKQAIHELNTEAIYNLILEDKPCALCGRKIDLVDTSLDHIVPLSTGGTNTVDNIQIMHKWCNLFKMDMDMEDAKRKFEKIYTNM